MKKITFVIILAALAILVGCSEKKPTIDISQTTDPTTPTSLLEIDNILPGQVDSLGIIPITEQTIATDLKTDPLLTGSQKLYRSFDFVGLATRTYQVGNDTISVDVAQFDSRSCAFGYVATLRPTGVELLPLGSETFKSGNSTYMFHDRYVATLSPLTENGSITEAQAKIIKMIESAIGGRKMIPQYFILFPYKARITPSGRFVRYDFLDVFGINEVYSFDYEFDGDTLTFFLTPDKSGEKYINFRQLAESTGEVVDKPKGFTFDENFEMAFEHPEHGVIVAGLKQGKLIGVIGYKPRKMATAATAWITSFR